MGKKQKQVKSREIRKQKKEERKNRALGLTYVSSSNKMKHQNVSVPQLKKQKEKIISDLQQKQKNSARAALIESLNQKLKQNNPVSYSNLYQMAQDSTANANLYDHSADNYLESNIEKLNDKKLNDYTKDNSRKAYMKILNEVIENSDVILEVLDARDPMSCRSKEMESLVVGSKNKHQLKIHLNPQIQVSKYLAYLL